MSQQQQRKTVADIDAETVYVLPNKAGSTRKAHLKPDCGQMTRTDRKPEDKDAGLVPNHEVCGTCAGDATPGGGWSGMKWRGKIRNSKVKSAIEGFGGFPSRCEIDGEMDMQDGRIGNALASLCERGEVDRIGPKTGEKGYPKYRIADEEAGEGVRYE
jgi:hypothetical protein